MKRYLPILLISLIYLSLRLLFLWQIPLFEDEALFTGWSLSMAKDIHAAAYPLSAGISPLFSWITAIFLPLFSNQFATGRFVSVLAGLLLTLVVYSTLKNQLGSTYPLLLTLLFTFFPVLFVYNRLALLETLMVLFIFLSVYYSLQYLLKDQKKWLILFTFTSIFAILSKSIAILSYPAVIAASIYVQGKITRKTIRLILASVLGVSVILLIFFPYRVYTSAFLSDYIFIPKSAQELVLQCKKNLWLTLHWLQAYYSIFFLLSALIGLYIGLRRSDKKRKYFAFIFIFYAIAIILTDKLYFPRHTLVFAPFLVILCSITIDSLAGFSKRTAILGFILLFLLTLNDTKMLITHPEDNHILAKEDMFQFYQDWTSGKVLPSIATYIDSQASTFGSITVWVDTSLVYYYGLPIYLKSKDKVLIKQLPQTREAFLKEKESDPHQQFVIANKSLAYDVKGYNQRSFPVSPRHTVYVRTLFQFEN